MGKARVLFHAFNVGQHDATALARVDLERMRLAAEEQTNLIGMTTGQGFMRPGLEYLGSTDGNAAAKLAEFVYGATDAALLEFTNTSMRVWIDDAVVTRPAVTAAVSNGDFSSGTNWTLTASSGATCTVSGGLLNMTASARGSVASATQTVTVNEQGTEHALRIIVSRGPVTFRCGSTSGGDEYIAETVLDTGSHSLAFTPSTSSFYIRFESRNSNLKTVDSITVEASGVMELPTPWETANLGLMRFAQSADVVFVACSGYQPQRIERRAARSWSVVQYKSDTGPFYASRSVDAKLKVSATSGNATLTSDKAFFRSSHVGALFRLFSDGGIRQTYTLSNEVAFTDPIRVSGLSGFVAGAAEANTRERLIRYTITGTWAGTISVLKSSKDKEFGFTKSHIRYEHPVSTSTSTSVAITSNVDYYLNDKSDNEIVWYKLGFESGNYTSGTASIVMEYGGWDVAGICRVTGYTSATEVSVEILQTMGNTSYTATWQEGMWSDEDGWPAAVAFYDGRLWWSGLDRLWGSVSDDFNNFDEDFEGDAGPINRSIATGGVNDTQWLLGLQRLLIGTEGMIAVAKSSSLDDPITPTSLAIRDVSSLGVAPNGAVKIDSRGLSVERSGRAVMELVYDPSQNDYRATQLSKLTTDLFADGVKEIAIQRRPETRIWIITETGGCVCCVYEPDQEVVAFIPIETDGTFESVAVLPADSQDRVYFVVNRTINAGTKRYIEKMALDTEVRPSTLCKVMDAFETGTAASPTTTLAVGTHLQGETVVVWADGEPVETSAGVRGEYVVDGSGNITLGSAISGQWVAGLPYRARYKSARLAYGTEGGTAMLAKKSLDEVGLIMTNFTRQGIRVGTSFTKMYDLPSKVLGQTVSDIVLDTVDDGVPFSVGGGWSLDNRMCIEVNSPYTATFCGMTLSITANL